VSFTWLLVAEGASSFRPGARRGSIDPVIALRTE